MEKGLNKENARSANGAVLNAITGGKDYSNGATHWDGTDLGYKGGAHYRSKLGFEASAEHTNTYNNNTGYNIKSTGKNPTFTSTAAYGKSIFWQSHPNNTKNVIYHKYFK